MAVRVADMQWSMAVISNMYPGSPFSPPCSAYSIPVQLAASVGLWDGDELSIGEDFHMYIKCFFSTHGQLKLLSIYSPASCCNIEGVGYFGGIHARIVQAKRHMWGSLDLGYTLRRAMFGLFAPTFDLPRDQLSKLNFSPFADYNFDRLAAQLIPFSYFLFEAHIFVGQTLLSMIIAKWIIPAEDSTTVIWTLLAGDVAVHPHVAYAVALVEGLTKFATIFFAAGILYYEGFQHWCGVERWTSKNPNLHSLGIRSKLQSTRKWYQYFEWLLIPFCGLFFLIIPQANAHIKQLWTSYLTYVVAAKPQHDSLPIPSNSDASQIQIRPGMAKERDREDSGFYAFDDDNSGQYNPEMWRLERPGSPSLESVVTVVN